MTTHATTRVLTIRDAGRLAEVLRAAETNARVRWLLASGDVAEGTARSIGDERGMFAGPEDDVRDCYLRVTTVSGWDTFLPVARVAEQVGSGEFVVGEW